MKRMFHPLYLILSLLGTALFVYAVSQYIQIKKLEGKGIRTEAVVVSLREESDGEGIRMYRSIFEFRDQNGEVRSHADGAPTYSAARSIGEKVELYYDPTEPENARVISFWGLYRTPVIVWAFAVPMMIIGLSWFMFHWRGTL